MEGAKRRKNYEPLLPAFWLSNLKSKYDKLFLFSTTIQQEQNNFKAAVQVLLRHA